VEEKKREKMLIEKNKDLKGHSNAEDYAYIFMTGSLPIMHRSEFYLGIPKVGATHGIR
jgi:hypothetical protein